MNTVRELTVHTRDESHAECMRDLEDVAKKIKEIKAVAFSVAIVGQDGTISTMWCHPKGASCYWTLVGATDNLRFRLLKDANS